MISWFSSWAKGIILAVVIVTILEMILPEGKNKKYIKIVMGVYIMFSIVSPIISKITNSEISLDISKYENILGSGSTVQTSSDLNNVNSQNIENIYLNSIKTNIKDELERKGYGCETVNITANINIEKQEAEIYKIDIAGVIEKEDDSIKKVNKVVIGEAKDNEKNNNTLTAGQINELKEHFSDKYEIEKNKIGSFKTFCFIFLYYSQI